MEVEATEVAGTKNASNGKVRPIIKWTGGKYAEYAEFAHLVPHFSRYYEPFFGGGGVFFALQPQGSAFLNDKSKDLMQFYAQMQQPALHKELLLFADAWAEAGFLSGELMSPLLAAFQSFIQHALLADQLKNVATTAIHGLRGHYVTLFSADFIGNPANFSKALLKSILSKFGRIKTISTRETRAFTRSELEDHIETAVRGALYLFLRNNLNNPEFAAPGSPKAVANWYFIREFCYASMFRYNQKGVFNIPYGGIAYNRKNFRVKVEHIFSPLVRQLFTKASFHNLDFADFFLATKPTADDFIFLDPPYDSEFSEYDQNAFTRHDQVRLRDCLLSLKAKWMLVIKETTFIRDLYAHPSCRFVEFDKTYTYNVRGRNNRDTRHLIILNYDR